jgi:hypothetical protein
MLASLSCTNYLRTMNFAYNHLELPGPICFDARFAKVYYRACSATEGSARTYRETRHGTKEPEGQTSSLLLDRPRYQMNTAPGRYECDSDTHSYRCPMHDLDLKELESANKTQYHGKERSYARELPVTLPLHLENTNRQLRK